MKGQTRVFAVKSNLGKAKEKTKCVFESAVTELLCAELIDGLQIPRRRAIRQERRVEFVKSSTSIVRFASSSLTFCCVPSPKGVHIERA